MKHLRSRFMTIVGSILLSLSFTGAISAQEGDKSGTITEIANGHDSITVRLDGETTTETYSIDADTEITFRGGRGTVEDLSPGDRVLLDFETDNASSRRANRVAQGEVPNDKVAEVVGVEAEDNQLTVRFRDTNEVETYTVAPDVDIWIRNSPGSLTRNRAGELEEIKVGDEVVLAFDEIDRDQSNRPTLRIVTYDGVDEDEEIDTRVAANVRSDDGSTNRFSSLPRTASVFPALGLLGMALLALAGWVRSRRVVNHSSQ